jgi:predicted nucleic acid-binding protein
VILYLDTSAFVKLVVDETGAAETRAWFAQAHQACASVITYPEAIAAFCRQDREAGGEGDRLPAWLATLEASWRRCIHVPVFERRAAKLALAHALRGMDAVQLASASELRARVLADSPSADFHFAAFDRHLLEAAEREGFATLGGPLP